MNLRRTAGTIAFLGTLSSPVEAGETQKVELIGISDNDLHDDLVLARGEVRGYEGLFVNDPDAMPVAKHETSDDKFVYFDVLAEDGVSTVCLGVDHLLKESEGNWRIDTSTARITHPNEKCRDMLDAIPQDYEDVVDTPELQSLSSSSNWKDGIEIGFMMGPYMEEYDVYTRGINPDFRFIGYLPVGGSPWKLGATTNFYAALDEMERKGLGRIGGAVAREFTLPKTENELTLSVQGGWSKDYNPLLNAPYAGFAATLELARFDALNASLVSDVLVVHEFIGNEQLELAYTGSLGVMVHPGQFIDNDRERPVRTKPEAVIAFEPDELESSDTVMLVDRTPRYNRMAYEDLPEFDYKIKIDNSEDTYERGEIIRFEDDLKKAIIRAQNAGSYDGAYSISKRGLAYGAKAGIELYAGFYELSYTSGTANGDMLFAYECAKNLVARDYVSDGNLDEWINTLNAIEKNYGWVSLEGETLEFAFPFDANKRLSLERAAALLKETGEFHGLLPVQEMTLDGVAFSPTAIVDGDQVTVVQP